MKSIHWVVIASIITLLSACLSPNYENSTGQDVAADKAEITQDMRHQVIDDLVTQFMPPKSDSDQWDTEGLQAAITEELGLEALVVEWAAAEGVDDGVIRARLEDLSDEFMAKKAVDFGPETNNRPSKLDPAGTVTPNLFHSSLISQSNESAGSVTPSNETAGSVTISNVSVGIQTPSNVSAVPAQ